MSLAFVPAYAHAPYKDRNWPEPYIEAIPNPSYSFVPAPYEIKNYIRAKAKEAGLNERTLLRVAECESNFRIDAVGDNGLARGLWQYHRPTFDLFGKQSGMEGLDYYDWQDQTTLTVWAFRTGKAYHWSCY